MAKYPPDTLRAAWLPTALLVVSRALLLMPEVALIAVLVCVYSALGRPPLLALLAVLLVVSFMARSAALLGASAALHAARYRRADALSRLALLLYPWSADALALRGAVALATGAPEDAEVALRRAIALLPGRATHHAALSGALLEQGRPSEAAAAAREAVRLDPNNGAAHLCLAEAERERDAAPELIEAQLRTGLAVARSPEVIAALHCALAGHLLAQRRVAEATLALHGVQALLARCSAAHCADIRFYLGELLHAQGQVEQAREHFRGSEAANPHSRYAAAAWRGARL